MGDWGRFVGRIVEDVVNDKASANDNGLLSKAKRKVRAKAIGSATHVSVDAVDSLTKPAQKAAAVKITQMPSLPWMFNPSEPMIFSDSSTTWWMTDMR